MHDDNATRRREAAVILFLSLLVGGGIFLLLLVSVGVVVAVLPFLAIVLFLVLLHYLFWGRSMMQEIYRGDQGFAAWLDELDRGNEHEEDEVVHAERTVRHDPADQSGPRPGTPSAHSG